MNRSSQSLFSCISLPWLAILVVASLGLGAWLGVRQRHSLRAAAASSAAMKSGAFEHGPSPTAVAYNFMRAGNQTERLRWVRQPEKVAALVEEFFSHGRGANESMVSLSPMDSALADVNSYEPFAVELSDGSRRLLCVVRENGSAKVDFKAYARHGSVPWEDLLSGTAKQASEVRVLIQKSDYYNFEFADERRWIDFTATTPDLDSSVHLYVSSTSPDMKSLNKLVSGEGLGVTVAIRAHGESHLKRQFEITALLATDWVLPDQSE